VARYDRYIALELLALERELERFVASAKALERDVDVPRVRRDCRDEPGALLPRRNGRNGRLGVERGRDGVDDPRREVVRDGLCGAREGEGSRRSASLGWLGAWSIRGSLKDHNGEGFRVVRTAGWASSDAARAEILPA
jgi:hypothetical protein